MAVIRDKGVPIYCCGEEMQELIPGTTEASGQKHIPVYEIEGNIVHVTVGSVDHPMTQEHYISFLAQVTSDRLEVVKLYPEQDCAVRFPKMRGGKLYYYCNQHGLFEFKI